MKKTLNYREENLYERIEEMHGIILSFLDDQERDRNEIRYLYDFLAFRGLERDFLHFKENAHEVQNEDEPFPRLVL